MTRSQTFGITGTSPAAAWRSRTFKVSGTGSTIAARRSRTFKITGTGAVSVSVAPLTDLSNVEPESLVTLNASATDGGAVDSWVWRRVSGLAVGISGTGSSITFNAPSDINGGSVAIGVKAVRGSVQSIEQIVNVGVLPQTDWFWTESGWVPEVETWT